MFSGRVVIMGEGDMEVDFFMFVVILVFSEFLVYVYFEDDLSFKDFVD